MADIKNITIDGTTYDLKDAKAREDVSDLREDIGDRAENEMSVRLGGTFNIYIDFIDGGYIDPNNGNLVENAGWKYSDFIDISGATNGVLIYDASTLYNYSAFYDADRQFISIFGRNAGNIPIPLKAKYVRVSCGNDVSMTLKIAIEGYFKENEGYTKISSLVTTYNNRYYGANRLLPYDGWTATGLMKINGATLNIISPIRQSNSNYYFDKNMDILSMFYIDKGKNELSVPDGAEYFAISNTDEAIAETMVEDGCIIVNESVKIANYNVGMFNNGISKVSTSDAPAQMIKFRKIVGGIGADILNCQEFEQYVDTGNTYDSKGLADYFWNSTIPVSYGVASFSKYPIIGLKKHTFESSDRAYLEWDVKIGGRIVTVINAHLSIDLDPSTHRTSEIQELITLMNTKEYVILTGDMNASSQSEYDAFKTAGYILCNGGNFGWFDTWPVIANMPSGWSTEWPCTNLDNIIVSKNIVPQNVYTYSCDISDHAPIVAELRII